MEYSHVLKFLKENRNNECVMRSIGASVLDAISDSVDNTADEDLGGYIVDVLTHFSDETYATNAALDMFSAIVGWNVEDLVESVAESYYHKREIPVY